MIEPSRIKDEFKKVEKENHRFRTYLKIHADEDELDEQFLELHNELFKNYDCNKCRNCCREYVMTFEESDINSVAKELKITKDEVINKYIKITVTVIAKITVVILGSNLYLLKNLNIFINASIYPNSFTQDI